jgi:hypothetical protein
MKWTLSRFFRRYFGIGYLGGMHALGMRETWQWARRR